MLRRFSLFLGLAAFHTIFAQDIAFAEELKSANGQVTAPIAKPDAPVNSKKCSKDEGIIYFYGDVKSFTSARLITVINRMIKSEVKSVWINIISGGGHIGSAMDFAEYAKTAPIEINTYSSGNVESSATVLFMVGKKRILSKSAIMLFHGAKISFNTIPIFTQNVLDSNSTLARINTENMINFMNDRTGRNAASIRPLYENGDHYLTASEAKNLNIATDIGVHPFKKDMVFAEVADGFQFNTPTTDCDE